MPQLNQKWAAGVLGLQLNNHKGVDLIGDRCIIEVKFSLPKENGWTVLEYQISYPDSYLDKNAYWGLGEYTLSVPVSKIRAQNEEDLEKLVLERKFWIVPWEWMSQFPPSETSGKTEISEWENTLRYPKKRLVPENVRTYDVPRGVVYLAENVDEKDFPFLFS